MEEELAWETHGCESRCRWRGRGTWGREELRPGGRTPGSQRATQGEVAHGLDTSVSVKKQKNVAQV